ncbi:type II secretion system F family protein [Dehalobacter restrictus]|uniref:type II secretion system F family protein n=1 Tax=Dehalobacter restrictus TaxID=55583 RepID=UPI00338D8C96
MTLVLCYGISIGLLLSVIVWFLGKKEKKQISGFINKRINYLQDKVKNNNRISNFARYYNQRIYITNLKLSLKALLFISIGFCFIAFLLSIVILSGKIPNPTYQNPGAVIVTHNIFGIIIFAVTGFMIPWVSLNLIYHSTRRMLNKQALNTFNLILNNYIVRNNLEAATWDSIAAMPFQMRSLFSRIQSRVNNGEEFDTVVYKISILLKLQSFRDFYNVIVSSRMAGGNTEDLLYRLTDKIRSRKNRAQSIKEDLNPLISKAVAFTLVMILTYLGVSLVWPDSIALVKQSSIGHLYINAIIISILIEAALLLKFLSMED